MSNIDKVLEKFDKHHPVKILHNRSNKELYNMLDAIKETLEAREDTEKYLREELQKARDEAYASDEMQQMKAELKEAKADLYRGFGISEEESKAIAEWQRKHDAEVHGLDTDMKRLHAGGAIGGGYSYEFTPTSIGVVAICKCHRCKGKKIGEFEFQSL